MDKKTEAMLRIANLLTAEDLDEIRTGAPAPAATVAPPPVDEEVSAAPSSGGTTDNPAPPESPSTADVLTRGERERQRSRESKVSTGCVGQPRTGHEWWPVGTQLVGRIGAETFHVTVVENPQVKSGKSLRIDSGPAQGRVCITPTRAAIEATENHRQSAGMGRGGGVTNGWTFWQPVP
ncbi:MAG: hypothetical protein H6819_02340 [Phycisphaerales bacterium]|nr:hypothetical protein [Phycisphaerales bacterium]MCB9856948.1 hypothetical protein [Phycisphaerales bacterium]MCB9861925.1 hypothetical protein [Phycisphaerales bacterium]